MVRTDTTGLTYWSELERIKQLWDSEDHIDVSDTEWLMKELKEAWDAWERLKRKVSEIPLSHEVGRNLGVLRGGKEIREEVLSIMESTEVEVTTL